MNNKLIDLHTHTCYSDGDLTPDELIRLAIKNNIGTLSITDHNNILGLKNITYIPNEKENIRLIPGIELSAKVKTGSMHILGYNIDINNTELNSKLIELKNNNTTYILSLIEQIKKDYEIVFKKEDVNKLINTTGNIGRPDIAKLLIKYGYVNSVKEAFSKYLIDAYNKIRDTKKELSKEECIHLILNSGGIPILAHPKTLALSEKEFLILLRELISNGLMGIEVYHSSHTSQEMIKYLEIANKNKLLVSGGSDFHGPQTKPNINIGTGNNNLLIKKLSLVEELSKRN